MNERVKEILTDLGTMRDSLLAFADDVWQGINFRDRAARDQTMQALDAYNEKVESFDKLAAELSRLIGQFAHISVEPDTDIGSVDSARNDRTIRELDRATPHTLDEDFIYKRPYGFVLQGRAFTEITTWKHLYGTFCRQLVRLDSSLFDRLPSNPVFISPQDRHAFSRNPSALRAPLLIDRDIYAETHYSANSIRDNMKRLLQTFKLSPSDFRLYLRQDRDAGRDGVA